MASYLMDISPVRQAPPPPPRMADYLLQTEKKWLGPGLAIVCVLAASLSLLFTDV